MKPKDWAAIIVSASTLLAAIGGLYEKIHAANKDRAFLWDNTGDIVSEQERLKDRLAALEHQERVVCEGGPK